MNKKTVKLGVLGLKRGLVAKQLIKFDGVELCADFYERGGDKIALMVHGYNADPYVNLGAQSRWFYVYV